MNQHLKNDKSLLKLVGGHWYLLGLVVLLMLSVIASMVIGSSQLVKWFDTPVASCNGIKPADNLWRAPSAATIPTDVSGDEIRYGKELIAHTAYYLGPRGKVMAISNGMNCQNCHLDAGTKPFGNNYSAVASTYPKFRARSGTEETIEKRVNDCIERSLNGQALADSSREMKAIVRYIKWLGTGVPKGESPKGSGLVELAYLDYPADPAKGKLVYEAKCVSCHGKNGGGIKAPDSTSWTYPPLWGNDSYNTGAGLYRLSRFAGYIKANMPLGSTYDELQLSDEEAWNIAAYVNSLPRPEKDLSSDWPDISKKPIDHPFGPFADGFNEQQHKYGPFAPIVETRKLKK
ncbi:MAG: c-type cytochrome [Cyclobacteriaceae bacterium]|nr:c-type cytochrome [Cyclobacteriaceae bacterium]